MSPRSPPKISLRHEWTKELGSKVVQQSEGEVVRQTKFFQTTQPTPNPIRDRSGRLGNMKDGRNTSRSQEIIDLKAARVSMLRRFMIEQGDLSLTQLQYKTTLKSFMKPTHSTLMMKYFVKEWRNPLLFMTRIMNR